jgi:hypothetical protein
MRDIQPGGPPTCPVCQGQPQAAPCVICGGTGQAPAPLQVCDCGHGRWNHDLLGVCLEACPCRDGEYRQDIRASDGDG